MYAVMNLPLSPFPPTFRYKMWSKIQTTSSAKALHSIFYFRTESISLCAMNMWWFCDTIEIVLLPICWEFSVPVSETIHTVNYWLFWHLMLNFPYPPSFILSL